MTAPRRYRPSERLRSVGHRGQTRRHGYQLPSEWCPQEVETEAQLEERQGEPRRCLWRSLPRLLFQIAHDLSAPGNDHELVEIEEGKAGRRRHAPLEGRPPQAPSGVWPGRSVGDGRCVDQMPERGAPGHRHDYPAPRRQVVEGVADQNLRTVDVFEHLGADGVGGQTTLFRPPFRHLQQVSLCEAGSDTGTDRVASARRTPPALPSSPQTESPGKRLARSTAISPCPEPMSDQPVPRAEFPRNLKMRRDLYP